MVTQLCIDCVVHENKNGLGYEATIEQQGCSVWFQDSWNQPEHPRMVWKSLASEAYWVLNVVNSNYSFNSCTHVGDLFRKMFPESTIAQQFSCGERKCSYVSTFGFGPHFASLLKSTVRSASDYVVLFDESLNNELRRSNLICMFVS